MFAHHGTCFQTLQGAAESACAFDFPVLDSQAGVVSRTACTGSVVAGNSASLSLLVTDSALGTSSSSIAVVFPPCDVATFPGSPAHLSPADGALVAGAIATLWIGAFVWRALRDTLSDREI